MRAPTSKWSTIVLWLCLRPELWSDLERLDLAEFFAIVALSRRRFRSCRTIITNELSLSTQNWASDLDLSRTTAGQSEATNSPAAVGAALQLYNLSCSNKKIIVCLSQNSCVRNGNETRPHGWQIRQPNSKVIVRRKFAARVQIHARIQDRVCCGRGESANHL